jgi:glyoxylase-like metal-dependent hydrolase (beta-lactamase superfamily II)/8-oxo-dGTP pyrophosphatase MutT (NUDIX family)
MTTSDAASLPGTEVRAAATLVILRDSDAGMQVLLTVRPKELRFMGGAVVFPGGGVSPADGDPRWADASILSPVEAAARLGEDRSDDALASYICAVREAYEEVGLTLGAIPAGLARDARPEEFLAACLGSGVRLPTDRLVPAGRWVTPLGSPIRFDARFFVVEAPAHWEPDPDPREVAECTWSSPAAALEELAEGRVMMAPPTIEMLQRLETLSSVAETLDAFGSSEGIGNEKILSMRLSPLVHVVLAPNPGVMTGPGTNTYVVGSGPTFVIDPAVDDDDYMAAVLKAAGDVAAILVTHRHVDHVGGASAFAAATGAPVRAFGSSPAGDAEVEPIAAGERLSAGAAELVALHTPGHASDHLCFYMEGSASLFAGDNVLGEGTAVIAPPDGNMSHYMKSLEVMRALEVDRIYPGHFRPLHGGAEIIEGYISHRLEREAKIVAALGPSPADLDALVASAYRDTPIELHPIARHSALAHLEKLEIEGRATRIDDRWRS